MARWSGCHTICSTAGVVVATATVTASVTVLVTGVVMISPYTKCMMVIHSPRYMAMLLHTCGVLYIPPLGGIAGHHAMEIRRCVGYAFFITGRINYPPHGITILYFYYSTYIFLNYVDYPQRGITNFFIYYSNYIFCLNYVDWAPSYIVYQYNC